MANRNCGACRGRGWFVSKHDIRGLEIERCDACELYESDDEAEKAAGMDGQHELALALEKAGGSYLDRSGENTELLVDVRLSFIVGLAMTRREIEAIDELERVKILLENVNAHIMARVEALGDDGPAEDENYEGYEIVAEEEL